VRELGIYISASAEMDPECELLGQMLAKLTRSIRWNIKRTPASHQQQDPDWTALEHAVAHILLVGRDITAPIGVEYRVAREHGVPTYAYRSAAFTPSPALAAFVRQTDADWHTYDDPQELAAEVRRRIARQLIEGTPGYGLSLEEIESLAAELKEQDTAEQSGEERRGAGRGGVILPDGRG